MSSIILWQVYSWYKRAKIEIITEVEENLNPMTFGNLAHSILEKIYPHKILNVRDFEKMNKDIDLLIKDEMFKILGTKDIRGFFFSFY